MAYGIVNFFKGATEAQYKATLEAVHPEGLPDGQTHFIVGKTADGVIVTALWESEQHWETFRDSVLLPGLAKLGDKGLPGPPQTTAFDVLRAEVA